MSIKDAGRISVQGKVLSGKLDSRFMSIFAVRFQKEKFIQLAYVNFAFCAAYLTFFIAAFMPRVLIFSSPAINKKLCFYL